MFTQLPVLPCGVQAYSTDLRITEAMTKARTLVREEREAVESRFTEEIAMLKRRHAEEVASLNKRVEDAGTLRTLTQQVRRGGGVTC